MAISIFCPTWTPPAKHNTTEDKVHNQLQPKSQA